MLPFFLITGRSYRTKFKDGDAEACHVCWTTSHGLRIWLVELRLCGLYGKCKAQRTRFVVENKICSLFFNPLAPEFSFKF
jgi:hypothetical protein